MKKNIIFTSMILLLIAFLIGSCASSGNAGGKAADSGKVKWSCDFSDASAGTAGWDLIPSDEFWDFHGTASLSRDDKTLGMPMLRLDIDFTKDADSWWSEPKMKGTFNPPLQNIRKFFFDFYYNPAFSTEGSFKSKIIILHDEKELANNNADTIIATDELPNGYVKATVSFVARSTAPVDNMLLSIVGAKTNYKGPVFIGNMRWE